MLLTIPEVFTAEQVAAGCPILDACCLRGKGGIRKASQRKERSKCY